ncbi:MAG: hypothetical protein NUV54_03145 [Candidatus Taylorbacteria bacterium]|nr:hypothetical protein [Candidatus Taylorbacteria bacterium]
MERLTLLWNFLYRAWPPVTRVIEKLGFHDFRQKYLLGKLASPYDVHRLQALLTSSGFTRAVLAWKDPGEVLSMRRVHHKKFQYHIRLFNDGEIRGHYEYAPEANPYKHVFESRFEPEFEFFSALLGDALVPIEEQVTS